jgi:acyl-CoA synthetase (AMP-forming)/AMP-acid ligase II
MNLAHVLARTQRSNTSPREVDEVLLMDPVAPEVSAVGAPDPRVGRDRRRLARFKRSKRYEVIAVLPKNHCGEVLETVLRSRSSASDR